MEAYRIKPWEELTIRDDYIFKRVMQQKRICKKMLQRILHIKIRKIVYLDKEKAFKDTYMGKGIRLDVYAKDDKNTIYNIEMQMRNPGSDSLAKRTRYYQSMIDADLLAAGADYDELNETIIIFICPFDPFDAGRHIYTFRNFCTEDKALPLQDGATKIFLSTKGTMKDVDDKVKAFLNYVDGIISDDELVQEIDKTIDTLKQTEQERVSYMTLAMKLMDERKEGRREGREEGKREGKKEGKREESFASARELLSLNKLTLEEIAKSTHLQLHEVERLANDEKV